MADEVLDSSEKCSSEKAEENKSAVEKNLSSGTDVQIVKNDEAQQINVPLRENLVKTAVHFLQNPRVRSSSLSQKRAFLLKKGLTSDEVDRAIERAGIGDPENLSSGNKYYTQSVVAQQPGSVYPSSPQSVSLWTKWQSISSSFIVIGATCYGLYKLYKVYLEPWLFGKCGEDKINHVEQHLAELSHSLSQLRLSVSTLESVLNQQQEQLRILLRSQAPAYREETIMHPVTLSEIKSEISSIKSLLLSRRQFPATPLSNPSIPSWQMVNHQEDEQVEISKAANPEISTTSLPDDAVQIAGGDTQLVENEVTSNGITAEDDP